jgi:hypothetical protein
VDYLVWFWSWQCLKMSVRSSVRMIIFIKRFVAAGKSRSGVK